MAVDHICDGSLPHQAINAVLLATEEKCGALSSKYSIAYLPMAITNIQVNIIWIENKQLIV